MKEIPLTQGKVALVDDEDYDWLIAYKWHASYVRGKWYALRNVPGPLGKYHKERMHCAILNPPSDRETDHKNGDGLDNRRQNLRSVTHAQNMQNRKKQANNTSGYRGVYLSQGNRWIAQIKISGHMVNLGSFGDPKDAARVFDAAAREARGEFARTNF